MYHHDSSLPSEAVIRLSGMMRLGTTMATPDISQGAIENWLHLGREEHTKELTCTPEGGGCTMMARVGKCRAWKVFCMLGSRPRIFFNSTKADLPVVFDKQCRRCLGIIKPLLSADPCRIHKQVMNQKSFARAR